MLKTAPPLHARRRALAGEGRPPILDVIDLAVVRFRQSPGSFDPAELFRELDRAHRVELIARIMAERPKRWARRTGGADRFARHVCELAERPALPS